MMNGNMTKRELKKWRKRRAVIRARITQHNFEQHNQPNSGLPTSVNPQLKPQARSAIELFVAHFIMGLHRQQQPTQQARSSC